MKVFALKKKFIVPLVAWSLATVGTFATMAPSVAGNAVDRQIEAETLRRFKEANKQQGMPAIENYVERRFVKKIYELRDQNIATYSYLADKQAQMHFLCRSLGYGIPYSVQYTNPFRVEHTVKTTYLRVPLPEPNTLHTPKGLHATWVICQASQGSTQPLYVEPKVIVSPVALSAVNSYLAEPSVQGNR